jgi:hypothetical protein
VKREERSVAKSRSAKIVPITRGDVRTVISRKECLLCAGDVVFHDGWRWRCKECGTPIEKFRDRRDERRTAAPTGSHTTGTPPRLPDPISADALLGDPTETP